MFGHIQKRATSTTCILNDAEFKQIVINCTKKTNDFGAARKFIVQSNTRRWKKQKQKVINTNSVQRSFSGPKHWHFQELELEIF
jgi:hypothetical protein